MSGRRSESSCVPCSFLRNVQRLGIPDRFIEHAERNELLADLGLDVEGFCRAARKAFAKGREEDVAAVG
jgi:1-deoxy-D-xylulose-5-phosphate synthase